MNEVTLSRDTNDQTDGLVLGLLPLDPVWNVTLGTRKYIEQSLKTL